MTFMSEDTSVWSYSTGSAGSSSTKSPAEDPPPGPLGVAVPLLSAGWMCRFSSCGFDTSSSRQRTISSKVSSSSGVLPKRVKKLSIVSLHNVEPSESSIEKSSTYERRPCSPMAYCSA